MTNAIRLCCTYILSENVPMNTNRKPFEIFFLFRQALPHFPTGGVGDEYRARAQGVQEGAVQPDGDTSGLLGDQRPGGIVPGRQSALEEDLRPAAGHHAAVQGR